MANEKGFSIIEFIVTMALLLVVFAAAFSIFVPVARRSKIEGGNVETQIEGVIGLELLRKDIVHAGAGLPWVLNGADFSEAVGADPDGFNDDKTPIDDPPRPLILKNAITTAGLGMNSSDYLVIKSQLVATPITPDGTNYQDNPAGEKWSYVNPDGTTRTWNSADDDLTATDRVIVVQPVTGTAEMVLAVDAAASNKFWTTYNAASMPVAYRPTGNAASYIFGIDSATDPRMPFNRADYYLSSNNVPSKCAPGTGTLVKRVLRQDNGQFGKELPLLDCVAAFQIVFGIDNTFADNLPQRNCLTNDPATVTINGMPVFDTTFSPADAERSTMREVRVYILVQEGTFDMEYNFKNFTTGTSILVGENDPNDCDAPGTTPANQSCDCASGADAVVGQLFDMATLPPDPIVTRNWTYNKFRWRVYKLTIKPEGIVHVE